MKPSNTHPPLEGGSKSFEQSENDFGEGSWLRRRTPPRKILRFATNFSTLPQGEGQVPPYLPPRERTTRSTSLRTAPSSSAGKCSSIHSRMSGLTAARRSPLLASIH